MFFQSPFWHFRHSARSLQYIMFYCSILIPENEVGINRKLDVSAQFCAGLESLNRILPGLMNKL